MGIFDQLFGGGQAGAYQGLANNLGQISPELEMYRQMATGGLQPYQQAGTQALGQYQTALAGMSDPTQFIGNIMKSYSTSPEAQQQIQQSTQAANSAASASGMLGSGAEQKALQQNAQQLTAADQQQYLQNIMGAQGQYMGGLQELLGGGQQAATTAGGFDMSTGQNIGNIMAQIAAAQAQGQMGQGQTYAKMGKMFGFLPATAGGL